MSLLSLSSEIAASSLFSEDETELSLIIANSGFLLPCCIYFENSSFKTWKLVYLYKLTSFQETEWLQKLLYIFNKSVKNILKASKIYDIMSKRK